MTCHVNGSEVNTPLQNVPAPKQMLTIPGPFGQVLDMLRACTPDAKACLHITQLLWRFVARILVEDLAGLSTAYS